ncbi:Asp23/Gls24 family envelope stress response protein [Pseudonocardia hispaniensis]|uniref:Asp23/Gls24 family envelope stress response protein n=1 Tax=Pseudonocardia hispaniensis TaxID=904933 RepID=A0ABW1J8J4_9PSEU
MAVMLHADTAAAGRPIEPLPCGRDAAQVWDHATSRRPDAHELGCPHCTAVAADARGLARFVHRIAAEPLDPPPSLLGRVIGAVSLERFPHDLVTLESPHGPVALSRAAAAAVLRHGVDQLDGVRARSCRIEQPDPGALHVAMTVTVRFGADLTTLAARVRSRVLAEGEQTLGLPVRRVDIEIVDMFDVPGVPR